MSELIIDDEKGRRKVDLSSIEKLLFDLDAITSSEERVNKRHHIKLGTEILKATREMDEDQLRYLVAQLYGKLSWQIDKNLYTRESYFNMQGIAKKIAR